MRSPDTNANNTEDIFDGDQPIVLSAYMCSLHESVCNEIGGALVTKAYTPRSLRSGLSHSIGTTHPCKNTTCHAGKVPLFRLLKPLAHSAV